MAIRAGFCLSSNLTYVPQADKREHACRGTDFATLQGVWTCLPSPLDLLLHSIFQFQKPHILWC